MKYTITANELKTKGVSALDMVVRESEEAVVTIRGKNAYVIMPIEKYKYYKECELEAALAETNKDLEDGNYFEESVEDHIKRITNA